MSDNTAVLSHLREALGCFSTVSADSYRSGDLPDFMAWGSVVDPLSLVSNNKNTSRKGAKKNTDMIIISLRLCVFARKKYFF